MKTWRVKPGMGATEEILVHEYTAGENLPSEVLAIGARKEGELMVVGKLPHPDAVYPLETGGVITIGGGAVGWQPPASMRGPRGNEVQMTWREVLGRRYREVIE